MATKTITSGYQELRDGGQSILKGLHQLSGVFQGIKIAARAAAENHDTDEVLNHVASLSGLGAEQASIHINRLSDLNDLVDDLDRPVVDMTLSALQADSIKSALHALLQIIPEDQTDVAGSIKTVIRLADSLAMHLITGGQHKLLKEALEKPVTSAESALTA